MTKYRIVKVYSGRRETVMEGGLAKLNNRLKELRRSTRGGKSSGIGGKSTVVRYELEQVTADA